MVRAGPAAWPGVRLPAGDTPGAVRDSRGAQVSAVARGGAHWANPGVQSAGASGGAFASRHSRARADQRQPRRSPRRNRAGVSEFRRLAEDARIEPPVCCCTVRPGAGDLALAVARVAAPGSGPWGARRHRGRRGGPRALRPAGPEPSPHCDARLAGDRYAAAAARRRRCSASSCPRCCRWGCCGCGCGAGGPGGSPAAEVPERRGRACGPVQDRRIVATVAGGRRWFPMRAAAYWSRLSRSVMDSSSRPTAKISTSAVMSARCRPSGFSGFGSPGGVVSVTYGLSLGGRGVSGGSVSEAASVTRPSGARRRRRSDRGRPRW